MKLPEDKVKEILRLKEQGLSSRQIASMLDVGKTTVNDWVARSSIFKEEPKKQPRLLVFDVEVFPSIAATFGRFNQTIGHNNVIREGGAIVSAAWKWYGDTDVTSVVMTPEEAVNDDDTRVVCELYEVFEQADAVIGHNCVEKNTKILTKNLEWVPAYSLKEGDEVFAVDEVYDPYKRSWNNLSLKGSRRRRKIKIAKVISNHIEVKPCVKVHLSNGDSIVTTKDHFWLATSERTRDLKWIKSENLKIGYKVKKFFNVWEKDISYESGWLSGFISGEGSLKKTRSGSVAGIQICQRAGKTWEYAKSCFNLLGYKLSKDRIKQGGIGKRDCLYADLLGGKFKTLELLGKIDVQRLKDNIDYSNLGALSSTSNESIDWVYVTKIEDVADNEVSVLSTTEKTFFANGYVMHNCNSFDLPVFKARLALHRMPMHKTVKVIDTYKISKGMRFNSRKLDSLADYFNAGRKVTHEGINLWIRCMNGDPEALNDMRVYNEQDVVLLEEVYNCIKAYDNNPVNLGQYFNDNEQHCPVCGSTDIASTGNLVYTQVSSFDEVRCNSCGHRSRKRTQRNSKDKRSNLLLG